VIQTIALENRSVTVSLRDGQRIITQGDDFYLRWGAYQVRVGFYEYGSDVDAADLLWLGEPERCA
jgi:hypothetical protein